MTLQILHDIIDNIKLLTNIDLKDNNESEKSNEDQLALAYAIASLTHLNQRDKSGKPYILHPVKLQHYLHHYEIPIQTIALLHDVIEDTEISGIDLLLLGFSKRVVEGVIALTKIDGEEYEDYKMRVKANKDACIVKLADLRHNSDIRRLKDKASEKDFIRVQKYMSLYEELKETLLDVYKIQIT